MPCRAPAARRWSVLVIVVMVLVGAAAALLPPLPILRAVPAQSAEANPKLTANRCRFTQTPTTWLLKAGCTTRQTIQIPNGITLDGKGKTIKLAGPASGFDNAGLRTQGAQASIRNLTLDGSALTGSCDSQPVSAIAFLASGRITNVAVTNLRCGAAIAAVVPVGQSRRTVELAEVTVTNVKPPGTGGLITLAGAVDATIVESAIRRGDAKDEDGDYGVWVLAGASATITRMAIRDVLIGVFGDQGGHVNVRATTISGVPGAMLATGATTVLDAATNAIIGPGVHPESFGVGYFGGASGSVAGNAISNFRGGGSCGIRIAGDAGQVTIGGGNTFPDPPGNEQNVCDA